MTRLHTYREAAAVLRIEESWLRRHIKRLPHIKLGRQVLFTDADLERITLLHHHEPGTATAAPAPGQHPMAHLVPLPARGSRRTA
ncbi:helix-turn-helix domain-containing protein [Streptomyces sp. 549]|uniref:helix-turn-helix domain-containing protein n=1 Tax=Streptomyces sp. 549 TaxID=3049076 RepID=UPI0024C3CAB6|nr:helix-turn-helix domain-containing protein [Streptomyces sp. 549]MDK1473689.1 helix-turn-helix domain-containing protein [Streptomyces sp. 549]